MTIKIEPYTIDLSQDNLKTTFMYWGIFFDDQLISSTSTKE